MKVQLIPLYSGSKARWKVRVDLSGVRYSMYVSWNTRMNGWSLTIMDINDNVLIGGIGLVVKCPLLEKYRASCPELPPGYLFLMDRTNDSENAEPTRENLTERYALVYVTEV